MFNSLLYLQRNVCSYNYCIWQSVSIRHKSGKVPVRGQMISISESMEPLAVGWKWKTAVANTSILECIFFLHVWIECWVTEENNDPHCIKNDKLCIGR